jgi:hypothetical protein
MNASSNTEHQTTPVSALFFAAIISTGDNEKLLRSLRSVLRQQLSGVKLDIHIFHAQENTPQISFEKNIALISFNNSADFFSKFATAIDHSRGEYCIVLLSGDEMFDGAFDSAHKIFTSQPGINWLTGIQTYRARAGFNIALGTTAMRRWSEVIYRHNLYKNSGRHIAPASTFWRKDIWTSMSSSIHFVELNSFYEDLWLAFFKTQKLYTCKVYFSTSADHENLSRCKIKSPNYFPLVEDSWLNRLKEFFFINNIPYLRLFYRNKCKLAPLIRFDYEKQTYFLNEY